jgi:predicted CxxxxCH...CXXCH cytochrome family protein
MGFAPISCSYCHNDTVRLPNAWSRNAMDISTLGDVPIANFARHVNGVNDVAFDRANPYVYYSTSQGNIPMNLGAATYDASAKNCSNVACHLGQTTVKWGTPYRWYYYTECDRCHRESGVCP